jgi:hypothetical protein
LWPSTTPRRRSAAHAVCGLRLTLALERQLDPLARLASQSGSGSLGDDDLPGARLRLQPRCRVDDVPYRREVIERALADVADESLPDVDPEAKAISFTAVGEGSGGEELAESAFVWTDEPDGPLGTGRSITKKLSGSICEIVPHRVTVTVTDGHSLKASETIEISVGDIC